VLLDPADRLLLLCSVDPTDPDRARWWTIVGGGIEPEETPEEAVRREVAEEVGIREFELGPLIWHRRARFRFMGRMYEQDNDYYAARTLVTRVDTSSSLEVERLSTIEHRWWTADDLVATSEVVYPNALGHLLRALLRHGPPSPALVLADPEGGLDGTDSHLWMGGETPDAPPPR
jgi:8-oxo-dGTP pyrophosphatase MutT (NUDIX family)